MFKRTNKFWKGLALVLALCMISTVAYAAGEPQTATVTLGTKSYNPETQTVTIAGTIDVPGNDVTILAVRGGTEYNTLAGVWTEEMLPSKVVYIDQETSDATTGAFSFSFKPRADVIGGVISVFVGGEDVANIAPWSTEAKMAAPTLVLPDVWYEGVTTLDIELKDGDAPFANADLWGEAIEAVTVYNGNDTLDVGHSYAGGKVTLTGFDEIGEAITKIEITTEENAFETAEWTVGLAQEPKNLGGNVLSASGSVVAPGNAAITVTTDDTAWKSNLPSSVIVHGTTADVDWNEDESILYVPVDISDKAELEELVTITVDQNYYEDETVVVTVVAPTKNQLTADDSIADGAIRVAYSSVDGDEDATPANMGAEELNEENAGTWGEASITLPAAPTADFNYVWTLTCADTDADLPANAATGLTGTVVLDRPDYESAKGAFEYTLKLTIEDAAGVYADAEKEFTLRVNEVGVAGVDVTFTANFAYATAARAAVVTIDGVTMTNPTEDEMTNDGTQVFTASGITIGETQIVITRPGYITMTINVEVPAEGGAVIVDGEMPAMIAGELTGPEPGTVDQLLIDVSDLGAIADQWGGAVDYSKTADLTGDGLVDVSDLGLLADGWGYNSAS